MSSTEVQSFFDRYRAAFNRLDGDAVADLWSAPSGIAGRGGFTVWADDAPMRDNMRRLCEVYRANGFARTEFELIEHVPLGADHAFANLRWSLWRGDGSLLQRFRTGYNLARGAQGIRVLVCTAYEEDLSEMKPHAAV